MHARVFDAIFRATFEATALRALAVVAALMTLRLVDSLVDRIGKAWTDRRAMRPTATRGPRPAPTDSDPRRCLPRNCR